MVSLEELGFSPSNKPRRSVYKNLMRLSHFMVNHVLKDSFEMYGTENLEEDYYQMFLCNHKFYTDPIITQIAITLASDNGKPIPAPAYKTYVKHKALGPLLISLFSYPIYGKEDGYTKREKSLQYSVECFLNQDRILIFPEGRIAHDGKLATGKIGSAEIAWRAYHLIQGDKALRKKKKGLKIIPTGVSYDPIAGIPWKDIDRMTVRFGKSIDFEEEVIDNFYSIKSKFRNKEKLKRKLHSKLIRKVMKDIGSLTTVNMDNVASSIIYNSAKKGYRFITKDHMEQKLENIVRALNQSDRLHLLDYFNNEKVKKTYEDFLERCKKKNVVTESGNILEFNLEYILSEPEFTDVRSKNFILYNHNLLEHSKEFKKIIKKGLKS